MGRILAMQGLARHGMGRGEFAEVRAASSQREPLIPGCFTTMNCWKVSMMRKSHLGAERSFRLSTFQSLCCQCHYPLSMWAVSICLLMLLDPWLALLLTTVWFQDTSSKFELFDVLDIDLSGKLPFHAKSVKSGSKGSQLRKNWVWCVDLSSAMIGIPMC